MRRLGPDAAAWRRCPEPPHQSGAAAWAISYTIFSLCPFRPQGPLAQSASHGTTKAPKRPLQQAAVLAPAHGCRPHPAARRRLGGRLGPRQTGTSGGGACRGRPAHSARRHALVGAVQARRWPTRRRRGAVPHRISVDAERAHDRAAAGVRCAAARRPPPLGMDESARRPDRGACAAGGVQRSRQVERAAAAGRARVAAGGTARPPAASGRSAG